MAVVVLLALAPSALGSGIGLTLKAPYKGGIVQPYDGSYVYGCAKLKTIKPWNFKLKTGLGGVDTSGKAVQCKKPQYGYGQSSDLQSYGDISVAVPFHVAKAAKNLTVNVSDSWSVGLSVSDGGKAQCGDYSDYDSTSFSADWGYVSTTFGSGYTYDNYSFWDRNSQPWNTVWSNGSGGNARAPAPFNANATTTYTWSHSWGGSASCDAYANDYIYADSYVYDESNGTYIPQSGNTLGTYGYLFNIWIETENYTSWGCSNSTSWNGPSSTWSNGTLTCYNYNSTATSYWASYFPTYTSGNYPTNSLTLSNSTSVSGAWYWNYSFNSLHHFELFFQFSGYGYAENSWPGPGAAIFSLRDTLALTSIHSS